MSAIVIRHPGASSPVDLSSFPHPEIWLSDDDRNYLEGVARGAWGTDPRLKVEARKRLDADLCRHVKPLASMTEAELDAEHAFWSQELVCRNRWGDSPEPALLAMEEGETELRRRSLAIIRAGRVHPHLRLVEMSAPKIEIRVMGAGKTRAEYRPSRIRLIGVAAALLVLLVAATAIAGQRAVELNTIYRWSIV